MVAEKMGKNNHLTSDLTFTYGPFLYVVFVEVSSETGVDQMFCPAGLSILNWAAKWRGDRSPVGRIHEKRRHVQESVEMRCMCTYVIETVGNMCLPNYPSAAAHATRMQGSKHMYNSEPAVTQSKRLCNLLIAVPHNLTSCKILCNPPRLGWTSVLRA